MIAAVEQHSTPLLIFLIVCMVFMVLCCALIAWSGTRCHHRDEAGRLCGLERGHEGAHRP